MSSDRTAEIWSTRLQRELLALSEASEHNTNETPSKSENIAMLPPFITLKDHTMDIGKGKCTVTFRVLVHPKKEVKTEEATKDDKEEGQEKDAGETQKDETETETEESSEPKQEEQQPPSITPTVVEDLPCYVFLTLDASMETNADGTVEATPNTYPFQKPRAVLLEGEELFVPRSDIRNGDFIEVDCDWTPSLHLSDAVLNVALKVRESIRKGDPFYKYEPPVEEASGKRWGDGILSSVAGKFATTSLSSEAVRHVSPLPSEVRIGDVVDLNDEPYSLCAGLYYCKAIRRPEFMVKEIGEAAERSAAAARAVYDDEDENEIPSGIGNYMMLQAGGIKKVAGAGLAGAGSIFKTVVKSTKSALEETFLMITDDFLIEFKANKFSSSSATVSYIIPISLLAKLKFRRNESLSLFFKQAPDDALIYMCSESSDAVHQIQMILKRYGVKGKHTNSETKRATQEAVHLVGEIHTKEATLEANPSVELVNEIMSLYRMAAEKFEAVGDPRHEEVVTHMREFLEKPLVSTLVDTDKKQAEERKTRDTAEVMQQADDVYEEAKKEFDLANEDLDTLLHSNVTPDATSSGNAVDEVEEMLSAANKELDDIIKS